MTTTDPQDPGPRSVPEASGADIVRSEEQLRVSTRTEVTGRVRVRKVVTSEEVVQTVTLRREELSVEHLAADPGGTDGPLGDAEDGQEIELVLHEERVAIISVPVERVRVRVHRVSEDVEVSEFLRRERVAFDVVPSPPAATES
jgi:uncharacterized protein (TIGR02271 family)